MTIVFKYLWNNCVLDFQGVITYEVDGIYPAPSLFAIHPTSGEVTVAKDLQFEAVRSDSQYKVSDRGKYMDKSVGNIECRITLEFPMFFIVADSRSVRLLPSPHQGFCHCHNFGDQKSQHPSMGSVVLQHYHQRGPPAIFLCSSSECCWCRCWGLYPDSFWNSHTGKK